MKKTIVLSVALVCIAIGATLSSYLAMRENISNIAMLNVEALTSLESEIQKENCEDSEGNNCWAAVTVAGTNYMWIFDNMWVKY